MLAATSALNVTVMRICQILHLQSCGWLPHNNNNITTLNAMPNNHDYGEE